MTQLARQLQQVVQKFAPGNTGHTENLFTDDFIDSPFDEITPVLSEAALSFDPATVLLHGLWAGELLAPIVNRYNGLSNLPASGLTPDEWNLIHTEIEYIILTRCYTDLDLPLLQAWLATDPTAYGSALRGVISVLQGNNSSAIEHYQHACAQLADSPDNAPLIAGLPALFYALALLRNKQSARQRSQLDQLTKQLIQQQPTDRFSAIVRLLNSFDQHISSSNSHVPFIADKHFTDAGTANPGHCPWLQLFIALTTHWSGGAGQRTLAHLSHHYDRAALANINGYAAEVATLFRHGGRQLPGAFAAHARGWLAAAISQRKRWQDHLAALQSISGYHANALRQQRLNGPDKRLVWWLYTTDCRLSVQPREQRLGRAGRWSKGRKIKLHTLIENQHEATYLIPADRALCDAIGAELARDYNYLYEEAEFEITRARELQSLVGHPNLYLANTDSTNSAAVQLELLSPQIEIIEDHHGDSLQILLEPFPILDEHQLAPFFLHWRTDKLLQVTHFTDTQLDLAKVLTRDGLQAPPAARQQLMKSINNMAPLVNVVSDIGGDEITEAIEVAASYQPCFELAPLDEGLQLKLLLHPLGENGPAVLPGRGRSILIAELDGSTLRTRRDLQTEHQNAALLLSRLQLPDNHQYRWELPNPECALELLMALKQMGDQLVLRWPRGAPINITRELTSADMQLTISSNQNWFEVDGALLLDAGKTLQMDTLLALLDNAQGRFLKLDNGTILALGKRLRHQLDRINAVQDDSQVHALAAALLDDASADMQVNTEPLWQNRLQQIHQAKALQPPVPSSLRASLRDYQLAGFQWLVQLAHWGAGACLADDMGLGKTLQSLALLLHRAAGGPQLVIAPTSVCNNWIEEAQRFAPTLTTLRFGDGPREPMIASAGPATLIICSYGLLQHASELMADIEWHTIVADEAQAFKNAQTKRSKAMMALRGECRLITTGTPIENHLGELWNLFRFINPGLLGTLDRFNERFGYPIEARSDEQARLRLKALIRPFILRRLKRDVVTELPPRTEITHLIEFNADELAFYEALRRQALQRISQLPDTAGEHRFQVLAEITRLRQASCHPRLIMDRPPVGSAKLRAFARIIDDLRDNGHRCLVFSQFVGHLALLREHLDDRQIGYQYLDGSTPVKRRQRAVADFQAGMGELFLISLKAGGAGLNLTAADFVIHMDPWWNPAVEDQASDRAHRMGQTRPVTIYRLVVKDTIEEKIVQLHRHKRDLADRLLDGTDGGARLFADDLLALLNDR